ncbi:AI-2E family transporter [Pedobacter panaciterrae]
MSEQKSLVMPKTYMSSILKFPLFILTISVLLYLGAQLFVPMLFGLFIAFVMYPMCLWLERHHCSKYLAITICLTTLTVLSSALFALLGWQLQNFSSQLPEIIQKLNTEAIQLKEWLQLNAGFTISSQEDWIRNLISANSNKITDLINNVFAATANVLFLLFLTPVYTVLFLYHRSTFVNFLIILIGYEQEVKLRNILQQAILTYAGFIKGMITVYLIVGILNSIGLRLLGIEHALLFGMLTAFMTIIPYVGIILSSLLPIGMALITKDSIWYPVGVIAVFTLVQYLEGNVIFPKVVGKQLNLSTWATLVAIITGGILWGVSGMILFIPMAAILKIVAQNIPEWSALYILLGRQE